MARKFHRQPNPEKIDVIGDRLRDVAAKQAKIRDKENKVPGENAWEKFKYILKTEYLDPLDKVGAEVNPLASPEERGRASITDIWQATGMGIGTGFLGGAGGKAGMNVVGITRGNIRDEVRKLLGHSSTSDYFDLIRKEYWSDALKKQMKDPKLREEFDRMLNKFPEQYLDAPADAGLSLQGFVSNTPHQSRLGVYTPAFQKIELNTDPWVPRQVSQFVSTAGHELEHWWADFIRDQTTRRLMNDKTMFSEEQFDRLRDVFAKLLVDMNKDPDISPYTIGKFRQEFTSPVGFGDALKDLTKARKFLSDDKTLQQMGHAFKKHGYPTEHASVGFEKAFAGRGKGRKFGHELGGDPWYTTTESFTKAAVGLRDVAYHHELRQEVMEEGVRRAFGKRTKGDDFSDSAIRWWKRLSPEEQKRMERGVTGSIEKNKELRATKKAKKSSFTRRVIELFGGRRK